MSSKFILTSTNQASSGLAMLSQFTGKRILRDTCPSWDNAEDSCPCEYAPTRRVQPSTVIATLAGIAAPSCDFFGVTTWGTATTFNVNGTYTLTNTASLGNPCGWKLIVPSAITMNYYSNSSCTAFVNSATYDLLLVVGPNFYVHGGCSINDATAVAINPGTTFLGFPFGPCSPFSGIINPHYPTAGSSDLDCVSHVINNRGNPGFYSPAGTMTLTLP